MPLAHKDNAHNAIKNIALGVRPEAGGARGHDLPCRLGPAATAQVGSRRRRLWELAPHCHCPLVGVSLPIDTLRRLVNKALGGSAVANDYEVHAGAVSEAARRCKLSELMQAELDTRYAREIQVFRTAKSALAVAELWIKHLKAGDVAGAFWAALSHPRCDTALQEAMCKDLHMFQHQAGAGVRLEIARLNALAEENAVLVRELGRVQERMTRVMAQKTAEVEQLQAELVRVRAESIAKEGRIVGLVQELELLQASIPQLEERRLLQRRLEEMACRQLELEAHNVDIRRRLAATERTNVERASTERSAADRVNPLHSETLLPHSQSVAIQLQQKTVLCVGGRSGNIANYRDVVERVGGRFAHHDGGVEDSASVLDANLAAADLVICQTGCISHNAYWRVKDFCKRTGKLCAFVENPSTSSLERGLARIALADIERQ